MYKGTVTIWQLSERDHILVHMANASFRVFSFLVNIMHNNNFTSLVIPITIPTLQKMMMFWSFKYMFCLLRLLATKPLCIFMPSHHSVDMVASTFAAYKCTKNTLNCYYCTTEWFKYDFLYGGYLRLVHFIERC
ncbi:hypothetical protein GQX74_002256 [Glossina fuscipes]|nr:hypothetical protein GQX74_002256 [Glossina fuscipes]